VERRFAAIHARDNWGNMTDAERSNSRGYHDGFRAAEFFASHNMSKLGFTGQYAADSVKALGPFITPSTEGNYTDGFMHGVQDGEAAAVFTSN
jgi:glucan 1,3-beta-glucosidase